jgi:hypothetical protein
MIAIDSMSPRSGRPQDRRLKKPAKLAERAIEGAPTRTE